MCMPGLQMNHRNYLFDSSSLGSLDFMTVKLPNEESSISSSPAFLPIRCPHGKWIGDDVILSQSFLIESDVIEVREKEEDLGFEEDAKKASGLAETLGLVSIRGVDEEDKLQKQLFSHSGMAVFVAVILYPIHLNLQVFFLLYFMIGICFVVSNIIFFTG
jgi:hypothetical protein